MLDLYSLSVTLILFSVLTTLSLNIPFLPVYWYLLYIVYGIGRYFFKDLLRLPLAKEGVYAPGGPAFLAHTKEKVSNIVSLTALRLAFFMGYE